MRLEKRLAEISLLRELAPEDIRQLCQLATERLFNEGELIINEGMYADAMYLILNGSVTVFHKNKNGKITTLATLEEDDYFGEQGFLNNFIRTSSVKAATECRVLEIGYDILNIVIKKSPHFNELLAKQSLGKSIANLQTQLHDIDAYVKRELFTRSDKSRLRTFKAGAIIFNKGDKADAAYFIASGSVLLEFDAKNTLIISENHLFGEYGVMNHTPRSATARAKTAVSVIAIPADDFINAATHAMGLKNLVNVYEHVYALPHHENITEQFISGTGEDEAIFTKYLLPNKRTALCATSIDHAIFTMTIREKIPDKTLHFATDSSKQLDIHLQHDIIVGIKATGKWPRIHQLCELLLNEQTIPNATENSFSEYLK